ncbi:MAG: serine hydroxymethyltransferase [Candidatus Moranbacteria bacterium]|nr:serine hydroxymethyltransferase [Candidatus Moranbacteria bacterium]
MYKNLKKQDPAIYKAIIAETKRQEEGLELIPSEIAASASVIEALGSVLTNKYSEGYPRKRYYGGQENIDTIEEIAQERAKKLFGVPYVNVQPYSGSPANLAVYVAVCNPGDTVLGQSLPDGGHLTHGWKASATSMFYKTIGYQVDANGYLDLKEAEKLAIKHKPKLIWVGATAYVREFPFEKMAKIADKVGAYLAADIAHIAGLVIAGAHKSPAKYAHIITTTTHKTLRGPRGGMIMVTHKGLKKDPELAKKIDQAIFPRLQGGPHDHQTAAIAVALGEAMKPSFKTYGHQVVKNAKALAKALMTRGVEIVTDGTDNHMILIKCGKGRGIFLQDALDAAGITLNKNTIPKDPSSPFYPSGVRLGTPFITVRGMKEKEMEKIADWIAQVMEEIKDFKFPSDPPHRRAGKKEIKPTLAKFRKFVAANKNLKKIKGEVKKLCAKFPLYRDLK